MPRPILRLCFSMLLPALLLLGAGGCARYQRDRCFLPQWRYNAMRAIFEETGSYQRVVQAMADEGWHRCEINTFRYQLRKDLELEGPEYDELFVELEPYKGEIDFHPGWVEGF